MLAAPLARSLVRPLAGTDAGGALDFLTGYDLASVDYAAPTYEVYADALAAGCKVIHPSWWPFDQPWNGYRHWLAYTPLNAGGDAQYENPSIACSTDARIWVDPPGVTNPLDPWPGSGEWNSDPHLLFHDGALHLFWRHQIGTTSEKLWRRTSTNGTDWSTAELILDNPTGTVGDIGYGIACPVILPDPATGGWQMWGVAYNRTPKTMHRWTAPALDGPWTLAETCVFPDFAGSEIVWHMTIRRVGGKYVMLGNVSTNGTPAGGAAYFFESLDGVTWPRAASPLFSKVRVATADAGDPYKNEFVLQPDGSLALLISSAKAWNLATARKFPTSAQILAAAVAKQGYLVGDDFIREDAATPGTTTSGSAWQLASGSLFDIASNKLVAHAYANNRAAINAGAANVRVAVRFAAFQAGNEGCFVIARANADLSKFLRFGRNGSGLMALEKVDGGVTTIVSTNLPIPTAGTWLAIECAGDQISIYYNNTRYWTGTNDFQQTETRHGIQSAEVATTIDGFFIKAL
jgi:hypothetical protein